MMISMVALCILGVCVCCCGIIWGCRRYHRRGMVEKEGSGEEGNGKQSGRTRDAIREHGRHAREIASSAKRAYQDSKQSGS